MKLNISAAVSDSKDTPSTDGLNPIVRTKDLTIKYADNVAVKSVNLDFYEKQITAIIGPSGCGKSTLLRSINRMNDFVPSASVSGSVFFHDTDLYAAKLDPVEIRRRIGMVFQKPNPFPKSIFQNIAWGPKINGFKGNINDHVEKALRNAALWDEVKDRLNDSALGLSGGQQQRLCIARTIAMEPEVILMDEPASALDPASTARIEELMLELKKDYTIVIVTHNMQQAARISDFTAFIDLGEIVEYGDTSQLFTRPASKRTEDYVTGRFG